MDSRSLLIRDLEICIGQNEPFFKSEMEAIADWIIRDRKRICDPLVKLSKERTYITMARSMGLSAWHKAICETLKLAGQEI